MGMFPEKPALMHVYLKNHTPSLVLGFPGQVLRIVGEMYGMEKALYSVRVLKEVDVWDLKK